MTRAPVTATTMAEVIGAGQPELTRRKEDLTRFTTTREGCFGCIIGRTGRESPRNPITRLKNWEITSRERSEAEKQYRLGIGVTISIRQGFSHVRHTDRVRVLQVRQGPGDPPQPVKTPGRQAETADGALEDDAASCVNLTVGLKLSVAQIRVPPASTGAASLRLPGMRPRNPLADVLSRFTTARRRQCVLGHRTNGDGQVESVPKRTRQATVVLLDLAWGASAFSRLVSGESTGTGAHGTDEHEPGRENRDAGRACDANDAFLKRLSQDLQRPATKLGNLVKEEYAVVSEADFARPRFRSTPRPTPRRTPCDAGREKVGS